MRDLAQRRVQVWLRGLFNNNRAARKNGSLGAGPVPYHVLQADGQNFALAGAPLRGRSSPGSGAPASTEVAQIQVQALTRAQGVPASSRRMNRGLDAENLYSRQLQLVERRQAPPRSAAFQVNDAAQLAEHVVDPAHPRRDAWRATWSAPVLAVDGLARGGDAGRERGDPLGSRRGRAPRLRGQEGGQQRDGAGALHPHGSAGDHRSRRSASRSRRRRPAGRDFFGERRRLLNSSASASAVSPISRDDLRDWYERAPPRSSTDPLADRFPFSKNERAEDAVPGRRCGPSSSARSDFRKRYRGVLSERKDSSSKDLVRFLDKVEEASLFLAPLWAQSESADGAMDVRVEFRVNAARELAGNEVADWSFRVSEDRLSLGGAKPRPAGTSAIRCACSCAGPRTAPTCRRPRRQRAWRWWIGW